jgi:RHS repeat-associated protein
MTLHRWIGFAYLVATLGLNLAWGQAEATRFVRVEPRADGSAFWDETSFVLPLDGQKGIELNPTGNNATLFGGSVPWFCRIDEHALARRHYSALTESQTLNMSNPIAAFGEPEGESPMVTGQSYSFGFYGGGARTGETAKIRILAYSKTSLGGGATGVVPVDVDEIDVPKPPAQGGSAAAWQTFAANGYQLAFDPAFPGLQTVLKLVQSDFSSQQWGVSGGASGVSVFSLTHTASSDDYYYVVELLGYVANRPAGTAMVVSPSGTPDFGPLYTLQFSERSPWTSTFIHQPHFAGLPLPSTYHEKSVEELLNVSSSIPEPNPLPAPNTCLVLDDTMPDLRPHPILDRLVEDLTSGDSERDALALANYVLNEIDLTDALSFRESTQNALQSIHLGGIQRNALAVYMEGQGSPAEQCAFLVYLLRKAQIPAIYVDPAPEGVKMLDVRLSKLLRMQLSGSVDSMGNEQLEGLPAVDQTAQGNLNPRQPQLIPVHYPWVLAHVDGQWRPIFPWLGDIEIKEGRNLYDHLQPTGSDNASEPGGIGVAHALAWVKRYATGASDILSLSGVNTPEALFPEYVRKRLERNHAGVSFDDIGTQVRRRKHYFTSWDELPRPFAVEGTPTYRKSLNEKANTFDTVQVQIMDAATGAPVPGMDTGPQRMADLHNRRFTVRHEEVEFNNPPSQVNVNPTVVPNGTGTAPSIQGTQWNFGLRYPDAGDWSQLQHTNTSGVASVFILELTNPAGGLYTLIGANPPSGPVQSGTIQPNQLVNIPVRFSALNGHVGVKSGTLVIKRYVYAGGTLVLQGEQTMGLTGTIAAKPVLNGSKGLNFNTQSWGNPILADAVLNANTSITIGTATSNSPRFSIINWDGGAGVSRDIGVRYNADVFGASSGTITVNFTGNQLQWQTSLSVSGTAAYQHRMYLGLAPFRPGVSGTGDFTADPVQHQEVSSVVNQTQRDFLVRTTHRRHRSYTPPSGSYSAAGLPLAIPDNNPTGITSTLPVALAGSAGSVKVSLNIQHTAKGNLNVKLISPSGKEIVLHNNTGGTEDHIVLASAPVNGFISASTQGTWTLKVVDSVSGNTGTLQSWSLNVTTLEAQFVQAGGVQEFTTDSFFQTGDVAAVCINHGRVTQRMLTAHAEEYWALQQEIDANESNPSYVPDPEIYHGTAAYLMGMSYYELEGRFDELNQRLHKTSLVSRLATGLARFGAYRSQGYLPQGDISLVAPRVDMFFQIAAVAGNSTLHPDSGNVPSAAMKDYWALAIASASAMEHHVVNSFLLQSDGASTVKLLQSAAAAGGVGYVELNVTNYAAMGEQVYQGKKLKEHDPALWNDVLAYFGDSTVANTDPGKILPIEAAQTTILMSKGPVEGAHDPENNHTATYEGVAVLVLRPNGGAGLISENFLALNGGVGIAFAPSDFAYANALNVAVDYSAYSESFYLTFDDVSLGLGPALLTVRTTEMQGAIAVIQGPGFQATNVFAQRIDATYQLLALPSSSYGSVVNDSFDRGLPTTSPNTFFDPVKMIADPVDTITGEFYHDEADLTLPGPFPVQIRRNYASQNLADGYFGHGWNCSIVPYLSISDDASLIYAAEMNGSVIAYRRVGATDVWKPATADNPSLNNVMGGGLSGRSNMLLAVIEKVGDLYTLTSPDGSKREFEVRSYPLSGIDRTRPYLDRWLDPHGNFLTFEFYEGVEFEGKPQYGLLRKIKSSNGNFAGFLYDAYGHITEAFTGDGRRLYYTYDGYGDLIEVLRPDGSKIAYQYETKTENNVLHSTHLIVLETKPGGRRLKNVYDADRRVTQQSATVNSQNLSQWVVNATFNYATPGQTSITDAYGRTTVHHHADGVLTKIVDPAPLSYERTREYYAKTAVPGVGGAFPAAVKKTVDKRGLITEFAYDASGNVVATTVTGDVTGDGNDDAVATTAQFNARHLPVVVTDSATGISQITRYESADDPYLPTRVSRHINGTPGTDSGGGTYAGGTEIGATALEYERVPASPAPTDIQAHGLLKRQTRAPGTADEAVVEWTHDAFGFATSQTAFTGTADPSVVTILAHNLRGELEEVTDADGRSAAFAYDGMGRRIWTELRDAQGDLAWWHYDYFNGNGEVEWSDGPRWWPEDYVWRKYDGAGRPLEQIVWRSQAKDDGTGVAEAPGESLHATTFYKHNFFGDLTEVQDPRGNVAKMTYDQIGRLTHTGKYGRVYTGGSYTETLLSEESLAYEPGDQVSQHTNPLGGVTTYQYTDAGARKLQQNPDGSTLSWQYRADGRLDRATLRNQSYVQMSYDDAARTVTETLRAAGGAQLAQEVRVYNRRGNLVSRTDRENHVFTFTYDDLDRLKTATGPAATAASAQQITAYQYDASGRQTITSNALGESTVVETDVAGRPVLTQVKASGGAVKRQTSLAYSPDHHGVAITRGTGGDAVTTTTFSDTFGNPVATRYANGDFILASYDVNGNLLSSRNEANLVTRFEYDALNRPAKTLLPDNAETSLIYNAAGNVLERRMPANLTWLATYDNAGRQLTAALKNGAANTRPFTYAYYPNGINVGLLQTVTDPRNIVSTYVYDDFLRLGSLSIDGSLPEHDVELDYQYDTRGLLTRVDQNHPAYPAHEATAVERAWDGYGQMVAEKVWLHAAVHSDVAQTWDAAGRRATLHPAGTALPSPLYDFDHDPDGSLTRVSSNGQSHTFAYGDNGLLESRANSYRTFNILDRDARGRILSTSTTVGSDTPLAETFTWLPDSRLQSYVATRSGGGAWNETRNYQYNNRRQLVSESFAPASGQSKTLTYQFDGNTPGGLGVRTYAGIVSGLKVDSNAVNNFARVTLDKVVSGMFTATGNALGAQSVGVEINNVPVGGVNFPGRQDPVGNWSVALDLPSGEHTMEVTAHHPGNQFNPAATSTFRVGEEFTSTYDNEGLLMARDSTSEEHRTFTWDGLGRLVKFRQSKGNDGFYWHAQYDGLGRRINFKKHPFSGTPPAETLAPVPDYEGYSTFDPEVEFLEIGLRLISALTNPITEQITWKVYGPDASGAYGGFQGIGGLEACLEQGGATTGLISDAFGHVVARSNGSAVAWQASRTLGFGPQADTPPLQFDVPAPSVGVFRPLAECLGRQGRYIDATGYFCDGARYYDPTSGRYISPDPIGHASDMSLYAYCHGDPINGVDSDGRLSKQFQNFALDTYQGWAAHASVRLDAIATADFSQGGTWRDFGFAMGQGGINFGRDAIVPMVEPMVAVAAGNPMAGQMVAPYAKSLIDWEFATVQSGLHWGADSTGVDRNSKGWIAGETTGYAFTGALAAYGGGGASVTSRLQAGASGLMSRGQHVMRGAGGWLGKNPGWNPLNYRPIYEGPTMGGLPTGIKYVGPSGARGTPQLALPAPKSVPRDPFHHIFPQRADLAAEFQARGINPHDFTMQIPKPLHQQIHSGGPRGGQWNQAWDDYFKANPSATATDVYKEAGRLIYQFDVPGGPVVPYPR